MRVAVRQLATACGIRGFGNAHSTRFIHRAFSSRMGSLRARFFLVQFCVNSALRAFVRLAWRWRFACIGSGVNLYSSLPFRLCPQLLFLLLFRLFFDLCLLSLKSFLAPSVSSCFPLAPCLWACLKWPSIGLLGGP